MFFYIFRVLFPALLIDLGWMSWRCRKHRFKVAIATPATLYPICTFVWMVILYLSNPAFRGQGVLGLIFLGYISFAFTILRVVLGGLVWFIRDRIQQFKS